MPGLLGQGILVYKEVFDASVNRCIPGIQLDKFHVRNSSE